MKTKLIFAVILALIFIIIGLTLGFKVAGLITGGIFGISAGAKKKADQAKEKQKNYQKQADDINKDSEKRKNKAEKINNESKKRDKKAQEIDKQLENNDKSFKDMFNVILILVLSVSILFAGPAMAQDKPELNPEKFKDPKTLKEANKLIDKLLDHALQFRDIAYEYQKLYREEKQAKKEYKELYLAERNDNDQLQKIIDNQGKLNNKLQEIIDKLLNNQKSFGIYGGIDLKPLQPENTGIEAGVTYDF